MLSGIFSGHIKKVREALLDCWFEITNPMTFAVVSVVVFFYLSPAAKKIKTDENFLRNQILFTSLTLDPFIDMRQFKCGHKMVKEFILKIEI